MGERTTASPTKHRDLINLVLVEQADQGRREEAVLSLSKTLSLLEKDDANRAEYSKILGDVLFSECAQHTVE